MTKEELKKFDLMVFTETFATEPIDIDGFYGLHSYAKKTEGRPTGGVSCYLKPSMGNFKVVHKDENVLAVRTDSLTCIAVYIRPQATTDEVIETLMTALVATETSDNTIIVGDINCRIDKANIKTEIVMETLREEGFMLANRGDLPTYIAHNGTSAIDVLLYRGKKITLLEQKSLCSSGITPIRKHLPIETTMEITNGRQQKENKRMQARPSRLLDMQRIRESQYIIEEVRERIKKVNWIRQ